jgi:hypothetical protein
MVFNIHLIDSEKLFIQLFNNCDSYFVKECKSLHFTFKQIDGLSFSITEYSMNGTTILGKIVLKNSNEFELKPFDFKLYLIKF